MLADGEFDRIHEAGEVESHLGEQRVCPAAGQQINEAVEISIVPNIADQRARQARVAASAIAMRTLLAWIIADGHGWWLAQRS
jgi:hypothetical protein